MRLIQRVRYIFFKYILGINKMVPWKTHFTSTIVAYENITFPHGNGKYFPGDSPGNYIQVINGIEIGKNVNIGNNALLPLMTFIKTIENTLGKKAEKNFMPMQDGDVVSTYADVSGLKPDTELKDGIDEFVKWYKNFYNIKEKDV